MPGRGSRNASDYYSKSSRSNTNRDRVNFGHYDINSIYEAMTRRLGSDDYQKYKDAQNLSFLSGFPIIGNFVKAMDQYKQAEDLFNRTGKFSAYPALYGGGGSGFGNAIGNAVVDGVKIASGYHDLYQFYAGEPDAFRAFQNGMYG